MNTLASKKNHNDTQSIWTLARQGMRAAAPPAKRPAAAGRSSSVARAHGLERCLTVKQVAGLLGYSTKQLRRLCQQGKIRTVQASRRAQYRIPVSALREFFNQNQSYWALASDHEFERSLLAECRAAEGGETQPSEKR